MSSTSWEAGRGSPVFAVGVGSVVVDGVAGGGVAVTTGGGEQDEGQSQYVELLSESARAAQRRG